MAMIPAKVIFYLVGGFSLCFFTLFAWQLFAGDKYESASYTVLESDGKIELREYPELTIATAQMAARERGENGSFMKLFGYISGQNEAEQKIAMTTPVFMSGEQESDGEMAFVLPKDVAAAEAPTPSGQDVQIKKRPGGKYAVIRFSGRMNAKLVETQEKKLREWIAEKELDAEENYERAGYDPPWTLGPFRRNEILIRLR